MEPFRQSPATPSRPLPPSMAPARSTSVLSHSPMMTPSRVGARRRHSSGSALACVPSRKTLASGSALFSMEASLRSLYMEAVEVSTAMSFGEASPTRPSISSSEMPSAGQSRKRVSNPACSRAPVPWASQNGQYRVPLLLMAGDLDVLENLPPRNGAFITAAFTRSPSLRSFPRSVRRWSPTRTGRPGTRPAQPAPCAWRRWSRSRESRRLSRLRHMDPPGGLRRL